MNNAVEQDRARISGMKEYFSLLWINLRTHFYNFLEFVRVVFRYYTNVSFAKVDLSLLLTYLFNNPFYLSKKFLREKGEKDIYTYGETPLTTLEQIAKQCQLNSTDLVYELGAGRGRTSFWLNSFIGCRVIAIEYVPEFVQRAALIRDKFHIEGVEFRLQNMLEADLTGATVIYLYGTCLEENSIKTLMRKFDLLPAGTKIITVSYPLTDYTSRQNFEVMKCFSVPFTWGTADVYLHVKKA